MCHGGQTMTFMRHFSPSTWCIPETELRLDLDQTQVARFGGKCLYLMNHLSSPGFYLYLIRLLGEFSSM